MVVFGSSFHEPGGIAAMIASTGPGTIPPASGSTLASAPGAVPSVSAGPPESPGCSTGAEPSGSDDDELPHAEKRRIDSDEIAIGPQALIRRRLGSMERFYARRDAGGRSIFP
jgi:hypothetical protein